MIRLLSRLPLPALYGLSRVAFALAYYVVRHRRHVIVAQLQKVFPEADPAAQEAIHRQFIRNYCDVMVEILKSATMPAEALRARVRLRNLEVAHRHLQAGRSVLLLTSHLCNWEWLLHGVTLELGFPVDAAYKPLANTWGDGMMLELRSRFGAHLVPAKDVLADLLRRRALVHALAMNADQTPAATERHQWIRFLGQDTAFFVGGEQIARAMRLPIIYLAMRRARRGHYEVELSELWDGRESVPSGGLTERYAAACEREVLASPADWLWTYRRWRFAKPLYGAA
jgi:KDO2-lipid IV(A) lauroyltransferase